MTISSRASTVQDVHSVDQPPGVADALTAAAHRLATGSQTTDLVGTAVMAVAAERAAGTVTAATPASPTVAVGPRSTDSDFLAAAALAVAAGRAEARAGASHAVVAGTPPAVTEVRHVDTSVRDAHADATAAAAAVGRKAAEASVAAVRRACSGAAAAADRVYGNGRHGDAQGGACSVPASASRRAVSDRNSFESTLHNEVDVRMERDRDRAVAPTRPYLPPVPVQLLWSEETTRETLQHLCRERGLPFGVDDSGASLKASLVRCNAQNRKTWGARMMFMESYVRGQAEESRGDVEGFQMAMRHPSGVGVDQPPVSTDAHLPAPPPASHEHLTPTLCSPSPCPTPSPARPSPARPPLFPPVRVGARLAPDDTPPSRSTQSGPASRLTPSHAHAPPSSSFETPATNDAPEEPASPVTSAPFAVSPRTAPMSTELLPSSHHAALMVQSFAAEQAALVNVNVSHFHELRGITKNIATAVNASAQSAAASSTRLDCAMTSVLAGNAEVTEAAAAIKAALPHLFSSSHRPSKRAKSLAGSRARPPASRGGAGGEDGSGGRGGGEGYEGSRGSGVSRAGRRRSAGETDGADKNDGGGLDSYDGDGAGNATNSVLPSAVITRYYDPIVHDMTIPPEMVTDTLDTLPLFTQLSTMLKLCHVTAGRQGLFGSVVVGAMYHDGVKRTKDVRKRGGRAGSINEAKSTRMTNIVKNKVHLYLRQLCWMHSVVPHLIKPPTEASFEAMQSVNIATDEQKALTQALRCIADEYALPSSHPLRDPIKATASVLRKQLQGMSKRPGGGPMASILTSSPFRELLVEAKKNVLARYQ